MAESSQSRHAHPLSLETRLRVGVSAAIERAYRDREGRFVVYRSADSDEYVFVRDAAAVPPPRTLRHAEAYWNGDSISVWSFVTNTLEYVR